MSQRYRHWEQARAVAQAKANRAGLDVVIRRTPLSAGYGFSVAYASRNDSDYAVAEIVKPESTDRKAEARHGDSDIVLADVHDWEE